MKSKSEFYKALPLGILLILLSGCVSKELKNDSLAQDYLPLQVGNYWELSWVENNIVSTISMSIDKIENLSGTDYYRMVQKINYTTPQYDTIYIRKTVDGKVYERGKSASEVLKFDFSGNQGDSWTYAIDPLFTDAWSTRFPWIVTFHSKSDTVNRTNVTFENCYRYYFDQAQMADDEYSWCLAPGVGFVKLTGWVSHRVTKAKINGVLTIY